MFMRRVNPYGIRRGRSGVAGTRARIRGLDAVASVEQFHTNFYLAADCHSESGVAESREDFQSWTRVLESLTVNPNSTVAGKDLARALAVPIPVSAVQITPWRYWEGACECFGSGRSNMDEANS